MIECGTGCEREEQIYLQLTRVQVIFIIYKSRYSKQIIRLTIGANINWTFTWPGWLRDVNEGVEGRGGG